MTRLLGLWLLLAAVVFQSSAIGQDDGPADDVAELQVLSNYVGTWEVVAGPKDNPTATGRATAKWILDGRFVQGTGSVKTADGSNDFKVTTLMTYDSAEKSYRIWSFFSHGMVSESKAAWDAETRTMTQVAVYGDITQTTESDFTEPGIERWTAVAKDKDGAIVNEMIGVNTRID